MESTFIAVMFFGWKKVNPKFHLASTWLTAIGAAISALWILIANAWMQNPVGMEFNPETMRNEMIDFWAIVSSPTAIYKFFHTVFSGWALAGTFVAGISCWMLIKKRNIEHCFRSLKIGGWIGLIGIVLTVTTGDGSAITVAKHQPMKLAAMEGLYDGKQGQDIVAFGIINSEKKPGDNLDPYHFDISIPYGLSILATHDKDAFIPGINDIIAGRSFTPEGQPLNTISYEERIRRGQQARAILKEFEEARQNGDNETANELKAELQKDFKYFGYGYLNSPEEAVPDVALTFYSFRVMVILGSYLLLFLLVALLLAYRQEKFLNARWHKQFCRLAILSIPLAYICSVSGWIVAEVGRQPWTIQDLMPNSIAISDLSTSYVQTTFWIFAVIFTALLAADICIMAKQISKKSKSDLNKVN